VRRPGVFGRGSKVGAGAGASGAGGVRKVTVVTGVGFAIGANPLATMEDPPPAPIPPPPPPVPPDELAAFSVTVTEEGVSAANPVIVVETVWVMTCVIAMLSKDPSFLGDTVTVWGVSLVPPVNVSVDGESVSSGAVESRICTVFVGAAPNVTV
jgi:hypothetical protein